MLFRSQSATICLYTTIYHTTGNLQLARKTITTAKKLAKIAAGLVPDLQSLDCGRLVAGSLGKLNEPFNCGSHSQMRINVLTLHGTMAAGVLFNPRASLHAFCTEGMRVGDIIFLYVAFSTLH